MRGAFFGGGFIGLVLGMVIGMAMAHVMQEAEMHWQLRMAELEEQWRLSGT